MIRSGEGVRNLAVGFQVGLHQFCRSFPTEGIANASGTSRTYSLAGRAEASSSARLVSCGMTPTSRHAASTASAMDGSST